MIIYNNNNNKYNHKVRHSNIPIQTVKPKRLRLTKANKFFLKSLKLRLKKDV